MPIELLLFFDTVDVRIAVRDVLARLRELETVTDLSTSYDAPHLRVVIRGHNEAPPVIPPWLIEELERVTVPPPRQAPEPVPRPTDRGTIIQGVLESFANDGINALRRGFAQSMIMHLRRNIDYSGVARRALVIDPLPPGSEGLLDPTPETVQAAQEALQRFAQALQPSQPPAECVVGARVVRVGMPGVRGTIEQIQPSPTWPLITVRYDEPQDDSTAVQLSVSRFNSEWTFEAPPEPETLTDIFDRLMGEDLF